MATMLEVKDLKKYFDVRAGQLHAVDGVSFKIEEGQTLGIVGESGCGKSTLGRTIMHLHDSTGGQILFKGRDITRLDRAQLSQLRHEIQFIFQDPFSSLNPRMTVFQTIAEPLIIANKRSKENRISSAVIEQKVYDMMDTVGLARRLVNTYPHELDGGRRQRIGIARALIMEPDFVICDEPVSALDVSIQAQVINLLHDLQKELDLTYLFISHDLSVVEYISDKVAVMYLGRMVEYAPTKALFGHPLHPYTESLLSAVPVADPTVQNERIPLEGEIPNPANPPTGCYFHTRCRFCTQKCREQAPDYVELEPDHFVACHRAEELKLKGFAYDDE